MRRALTTATALWVGLVCTSWAGGRSDDRPGVQSYLDRTLHAHIRYRAAEADLDGDGTNETVVYVTSPQFCGSGGCNTLVLKRTGSGYRRVMDATVTQLPIRILATRTHGWRDIGVTVGGGGIHPSYEALMRFDGRRYPSNPTVLPAGRLSQVAGVVLIGAEPPA